MENVLHRHEQRHVSQEDHEHLDQYTMVKKWEATEREKDFYPLPITVHTIELLRIVGLLNLYQEAESLKGNCALLCELIQHWDHRR